MSNFVQSINMDGSWKYTGWALFLVAVFFFGSTSADHFRMIEGNIPNSGPIEINATDDVVPLCDNFITEDVAVMICKQIGMPSLNVSLNNLNMTYMTNMAAIETCDWNMRNVSDCLMSEANISDCGDTLGISCGGKLRVHYEKHDWWFDYGHGVVEVYHGGEWNRVCADDTDFRVAKVMCGEMDDEFGLYTSGYWYDPEPGPFVSVTCLGNETMHTDCRIEPVINCTKGFGLKCNGSDLGLDVTPSKKLPGQVHIFISRRMSPSFRQQDAEEIKEELGNAMASVICSQKGFSRYPAHLVSSHLALEVFLCTGLEDMLEQCTTRGNVDENEKFGNVIGSVTVECTDSLRLADGITDHKGWLERRHSSSDVWEPMMAPITTSYMVSQMICQQLELVGDVSNLIIETMAGDQDGSCDDSENILDTCDKANPSESGRVMGKLGVNCKGTPNDGLGDWSPQSSAFLFQSFSGSHVSNQVVNVLCHELGYDRSQVDVASLANVTEGEGQVFTGLFDRWCVGNEESVDQCHRIIDTRQLLTSSQTILNVTCHAAEQDSVSTPTTTTTTTNTNRRNIMSCYQGDCLATECEDEVQRLTRPMSATCTLGTETKCFVSGTTQRAKDASSTVTFGCTLNCNAPGSVTVTDTEVNYCCNSNMCNLEPEALMEVVGAIAGSGSAPCRFTTLSTVFLMIVFLTVLCVF